MSLSTCCDWRGRRLVGRAPRDDVLDLKKMRLEVFIIVAYYNASCGGRSRSEI